MHFREKSVSINVVFQVLSSEFVKLVVAIILLQKVRVFLYFELQYSFPSFGPNRRVGQVLTISISKRWPRLQCLPLFM